MAVHYVIQDTWMRCQSIMEITAIQLQHERINCGYLVKVTTFR